SKEELETWKKAGKIAGECLLYGKGLIKQGITVREVCEKVEYKINQLGGKPAFPVQISLNSVAAHYCPGHSDDTVFKEGDIAKIDVGVHIDGCIGDCACSVDLSNDKRHQKLIDASKDALENALKMVKPEIKVCDIGKEIGRTIREKGFSPVINLSGHGLSKYNIHCSPSIPNYENSDHTVLEKGMFIAIEPFASTGSGKIMEQESGEIFRLADDSRPVRSLFAREILKEIKKYNGLPFTTRWLTKKFPLVKVNLALREMNNSGMIRVYPPLPDTEKGLISQAEHSVYVDDEPIILTKLN
ncbi:MAG: type II methionyl aminopeptidase, partial [Nanoarchaeota archaeon]|nr:type II methionyl aminopeptidase [Nanoarchaeota archaeon]